MTASCELGMLSEGATAAAAPAVGIVIVGVFQIVANCAMHTLLHTLLKVDKCAANMSNTNESCNLQCDREVQSGKQL